MDLATVKELAGFLFDVKPDVRLVAASHLLSVTGSDEGIAVLVSDASLLADVTENMARGLAGSHEFAKIALSMLINISDQAVVQERLLRSLGTLCALITDRETPDDVQELAAMLLANLTRSATCVLQLLEHDSEFAGRRFLALVGKFLASKEGKDAATRDPLGWLALVLQNCSQEEATRRLLLDRKRSIMQHMVAALAEVRSVRRRRGIIATIRNCLLDTAHHPWLCEPPVNLSRTLLVLLVDGRGSFSDEEKRAMPLELRDAAFDAQHLPEPDDESRRLLVESFTTLCYHASVAARLKAWSGYAVMRELERFEKNAAVLDIVLDAVEMMLRDHEGRAGADALAIQPAATRAAESSDRSTADMQKEILDLAAEERALEQCAICKKSPPDVKSLARCTGCFSVAYCGRAHQTQHWATHKNECLEKQAKLASMVDEMNARSGFKK